MGLVNRILMRMFGRPQGVLGEWGGYLLARGKREFTLWVIELLDVRPADRVLDVGFGPGVGIELLAERTPRGSITGIDYSGKMVTQATVRNAQAIADGLVDLHYGTVEHMPFTDGQFDKVLALNSIQVWGNPVTGLREIRRVMKAGGVIALGYTGPALRSSDEAVDLLETAGFHTVRRHKGETGVCVLAQA